MQNYLILNGKSSRYIQGLLIQKLPPISKPQIRTHIEEIDGRDGDIITDLGYMAYDREVSIGLHGGFDMDDVEEFFDSEGIVVFSNEPYFFYRYKIIRQIDFERLLRFRTAKVVFHCQPFKFSTVEKELTFDILEGETSINVRNNGNKFSKPKITIFGTGNITLKINGVSVLNIALADETYIVIDVAQMEAYKANVYKNRIVSGNYDNCVLQKGENTISWTGDVTSILIDNYSRWI